MRIDHVGIAVKSLEEAVPFYERAFGLAVAHREEVPEQKVSVAFLAGGPDDPCSVELLEPLGAEGAVAKFLSKRGPGLHHLAFRTEEVAAEMERLRDAGTPPLEAAPRPGARGHRVCFIHPKHCRGVLIEVVGS